MSGHLLTHPAKLYRGTATTSFNPLHVGAPTGTNTEDAGVASCAEFQSPPCRGTYWNNVASFAFAGQPGVSIPSMSGHLLTSNNGVSNMKMFMVSIPSMSGHLLTSGFQSRTTGNATGFNPLHVGALTDMNTKISGSCHTKSFNPLHVGAPTDMAVPITL